MNHSQVSLYFAGNIPKGHEKRGEIFWTLEDQEVLVQALHPCKITFLNPATRTDDLSDQRSVFGRDMTQVYFADALFVDARERRGLGVGAEMMWAKAHQIPVLTLAPKGTHYQKNEVDLLGVKVTHWIHSFVESLSDLVTEELEEAALWLKKWLEGAVLVKGIEWITDAMRHYQTSQLPHDIPMQKLMRENAILKGRIQDFEISLETR